MILSSGEALIDFVPTPQGDYAPCPGGSPYNLAIAAARLGAPTGFLGKISRDFFGDMLCDRLIQEGVDMNLVRRSERPSTLAFVKIDEEEEPRYAFYTENTADRNLVPVDVPPELPKDVECLEYGSISLLLEPEATTLKELIRREAGKRALSFDPNVRPLMVGDKETFITEMEELASLATVVKVSRADLEWMYPGRSGEETATKWLGLGAGVVVMTQGGDGAVLYSPQMKVQVPGYSVEVKDTIGAGDTFHAALLVRFHQLGILNSHLSSELTEDMARDAVSFAVKASALNCACKGANPPTIQQMKASD
ncbi:MAG: carbohydrate kinase [Spirochaetales bacterium]|nr:carbohydrate kinase [Spirochaetales bacterium]